MQEFVCYTYYFWIKIHLANNSCTKFSCCLIFAHVWDPTFVSQRTSLSTCPYVKSIGLCVHTYLAHSSQFWQPFISPDPSFNRGLTPGSVHLPASVVRESHTALATVAAGLLLEATTHHLASQPRDHLQTRPLALLPLTPCAPSTYYLAATTIKTKQNNVRISFSCFIMLQWLFTVLGVESNVFTPSLRHPALDTFSAYFPSWRLPSPHLECSVRLWTHTHS